MTLETVLRDLHDSEIDGEVSWGQRGWSGWIGCPDRGRVAKCESSYVEGVGQALAQLAVAYYPASDFAEKYRLPEVEKPGVTVRRSRRGE